VCVVLHFCGWFGGLVFSMVADLVFFFFGFALDLLFFFSFFFFFKKKKMMNRTV
jgi:hypothetical protein